MTITLFLSIVSKRKNYSLSGIALSILFLLSSPLFSQSTEGLTGIPDTSFTTLSAFISAKKKYPDIKISEEIHSDSVKEKYGVIYCEAGKRKLPIDIFYPQKKSQVLQTAVVILFGGGWRSGNRTQLYPLAERLAAAGYVCFTPDYRLSTEALYPAAEYDVKAAVRWVRKQAKKFNIDPERITVLGFSAGGELAAFAGTTNGNALYEGEDCHTKYSSRVNAIVDIDGTLSFVHPETGEGDDSKKTSAATYWFGFSRKENPSLWEQASPLTHAGKTTPPTLFINSSVSRMHAGRDDYTKIAAANGIYTEVQSFDDSPHAFCLFDPWLRPAVKYIDDFLKKIFK